MLRKLIFLLIPILILASCRKEELPIHTYTIEGRFLKDCSTLGVESKISLYSLKSRITSIRTEKLGEATVDSQGYYKATYQSERVYKKGQNGELRIYFSAKGFSSDKIRAELYKNYTIDHVLRPNDTAYFRTIGGVNLSNTDTLFIQHENYINRFFIGPFNDNIPIDTFVYLSNFGRQSVDWSVGIKNTKTMRNRNQNYGNYGSRSYERNICSSVEIIIDLRNFKK